MTKSNFWVIGGEFGSMNFHKLVEGSAQVQGPFSTRKEAEDAGARSLKRTVTRPACAFRSWKSPRASRPDRPVAINQETSKDSGPIRISGWGRLLHSSPLRCGGRARSLGRAGWVCQRVSSP